MAEKLKKPMCQICQSTRHVKLVTVKVKMKPVRLWECKKCNGVVATVGEDLHSPTSKSSQES